MKRMIVIAVALLALPSALNAANLQKSMKRKWMGAWVVTTTDTYSNCNSAFTNNRVNGRLVDSDGFQAFQKGELARVKKVDLKRSRLDLHLVLVEPILAKYQEGPFTLYRERFCSVALEVAVPRGAVKGKDVSGIDSTIASVIHRFSSETEAKRARDWNRRRRDSYPPDYDQTLAEHAKWKVEMHNDLVQARIDRAIQATSQVADRVRTDADYMKGFTVGIEAARSTRWGNCNQILAVRLKPYRAKPARISLRVIVGVEAFDQGLHDGKILIHGLELLRRLPGCFLPSPEEYSEVMGN